MKRALFITVIAFFSLAIPSVLSAQTQKGSWLVEGSIGNLRLSNRTSSNDGPFVYKTSSFNVSLNPMAGYFITEKIVVGAALLFTYSHGSSHNYQEDNMLLDKSESNQGNLGLDPFIRYYFTRNSRNRWYGQLQGGPRFFRYANKSTYSDQVNNAMVSNIFHMKQQSQGYYGTVLIGLNHFFTESLALNLSLGYTYWTDTSHSNSDYSPNDQKTSFQTGTLQWNMGFSFFLNRKKSAE